MSGKAVILRLAALGKHKPTDNYRPSTAVRPFRPNDRSTAEAVTRGYLRCDLQPTSSSRSVWPTAL